MLRHKQRKKNHFQPKTLIPPFDLLHMQTRSLPTQSRNAATNTVGTVTMKYFHYKT